MFVAMSILSVDISSLDFMLNSLSGGVGLLSRRSLDGAEIEESNVQISWAGGVETFICDMSIIELDIIVCCYLIPLCMTSSVYLYSIVYIHRYNECSLIIKYTIFSLFYRNI